MSGADQLLRPTPQQLAIAPELGLLAALDAILATAAYQLAAENPDLGPDALALGYIPDPSARAACLLLHRIHDFRPLLRQYADAALEPPPTDDLDFGRPAHPISIGTEGPRRRLRRCRGPFYVRPRCYSWRMGAQSANPPSPSGGQA